MNPVRVSVVIPAYNEEKLLGRCLASFQNQTVKPYEIIVVDNNSIDATSEIARQYGATVIPEANQGMIWARNTGFNHATGDILARCDADCIAPPEWIGTITNYYQKQPLEDASAIGGTGYYATRSVKLGKVIGTVMSAGYYTGTRLMLGSASLYGSCMAFPRSWWGPIKDMVCLDSQAVHEDIDLTVHLIGEGHTVRRLPGFYTYVDTRTLHEPLKKTLWRLRIWPHSVYRHRRKQISQ